MKPTTFSALPIGAKFHCNGNECIKRSSRTAELLAFSRVFYFAANTQVTQ